jgi:hypothetical protein
MYFSPPKSGICAFSISISSQLEEARMLIPIAAINLKGRVCPNILHPFAILCLQG